MINNLYRTLVAVALIISIVGLFLPSVSLPIVVGGVTNYDSLSLRPEVAADNALVVQNSAGTNRFVIDGSGTSTFSGFTQFDRIAFGGTSLTVLSGGSTSTLSAAQVCDSRIVEWAGDANNRLTLPSAQSLINDCLTITGGYKMLYYRNTGVNVASTTQFVAGASSTIQVATSSAANAATTTINGGATALFHIILATSTSNSNMVEWNQIKFEN